MTSTYHQLRAEETFNCASQKVFAGDSSPKVKPFPHTGPLPPCSPQQRALTCMQIWVAACPNEDSRGKGWFIDALWTQYDVTREVCACVFYFFKGRFC